MSRLPPISTLLLVLFAAGCAGPPPSAEPSDADGLVVITGGSLVVADAAGAFQPVAGPNGRLESMSASNGRVVVQSEGPSFDITEVDIANQKPGWKPVEIAVDALRHPLSSPSLSPSGEQLALLSAELGGGETFEVVVVDLQRGRQRVVPIDHEANGPPVWLSESRLLLEVVPSVDGARFLVLDLLSAATRSIIAGGIGPAVSGDGSLLAVQHSDGVLLVIPTANWLAADPPAGAEPVGAPASTFAVAVDATGARIAAGFSDAAGDPTSIEIFRREATGWVGSAVRPPLVAGGPTTFDWLH